MMIKGGFILQARKLDSSDLALKPPHVREVFCWLCRKARFKDGIDLKRGQVRCTYSMIQESLSWNVGARRETYKKHQIETALKVLRKMGSITTQRTMRGILVTICNYDIYQNPRNYANSGDSDMVPSPSLHDNQSYIREECNHDEQGEYLTHAVRQKVRFSPPTHDEVWRYAESIGMADLADKFFNYYESIGWMRSGHPIVDWKAALDLWKARGYLDFD